MTFLLFNICCASVYQCFQFREKPIIWFHSSVNVASHKCHVYNGTTASSCLFCSLWDFFHCLYLFSLKPCVSTGNIRCVATNQFAPQVWMTKYNNAPGRQAGRQKKKKILHEQTTSDPSQRQMWNKKWVTMRKWEGRLGFVEVCQPDG